WAGENLINWSLRFGRSHRRAGATPPVPSFPAQDEGSPPRGIRISAPELSSQLGELVSSGRFPSKAEAVRSAIERLVEAARRRDIGERIADGYRRSPQSLEEVAAATEAAIRSIHEEPW